ncbi:hypothetical protein EVAR_44682_1 [Eumeta japonica]|uniref:Uncharacterized protein n=1 Tax=Eumeta variegata TaxID=151549 RepID=A0A4C1Y198_EUMVA|nr:hypothetical protein EVAR_44682_1 [Eumeta japonica]
MASNQPNFTSVGNCFTPLRVVRRISVLKARDFLDSTLVKLIGHLHHSPHMTEWNFFNVHLGKLKNFRKNAKDTKQGLIGTIQREDKDLSISYDFDSKRKRQSSEWVFKGERTNLERTSNVGKQKRRFLLLDGSSLHDFTYKAKES